MTKLRLVLLAGTALSMISLPAMAQDAADFTAKLAAAYAPLGVKIEFGPATASGDTITVDGATVTISEGTEPGEPMQIDTTLTFSGVTEADDGSYFVDSLTVPDVDQTVEEAHVTVSDIIINSLYVPNHEPSLTDQQQLVGSFSVGPVNVEMGGKTVFSMTATNYESEFLPEQGAANLESVSTVGSVEGITVNLAAIPDPEVAPAIAVLGDTITGRFSQVTDWTLSDGDLDVSELLFDLDGLGQINVKANVLGATSALLAQLGEMQKAVAGGDPAAAEKAQQTFAMAALAQLTLAGASVRYDDASLAGKLLDFIAGQQNLDRATFVPAISAALDSIVPAELGPTLKAQVVSAAQAFLADPQSFEIAIAPAQPVNFMLLAAASQSPESMVPMLGVAITANQPAAEDAE